jgi:hypothetical protein
MMRGRRSLARLPPASLSCVGRTRDASDRRNIATLHQPLLVRRADLLSNYLSERLIDPVLPAWSGFLKMVKNVPINSQRDKLLDIRDSRTFRREVCGLRGCRLERRFSHFP